ncbi:MAG: carboxypeptidase regulatory-like domain-containing protein [Nitrospirae bacterium]|nr:carboxypeptidase regulatory-like domain-containing protein [Nitrospirota bacterium]
MLKPRSLFTTIILFLFVIIMGSCGAGGGGGGGDVAPANQEVKSYEAYTDSNGVARFTLANGKLSSVQVINQQTGVPIEGIKVSLISDGTNGFYMTTADKDNYIESIVNASIIDLGKTSVFASATESTITATLTDWKQVIIKDTVVPITQDKIPTNLWQYFVENKVRKIKAIKIDEIYNTWAFIKDLIGFGKKYRHILEATKEVGLWTQIKFYYSVIEINEALLAAQLEKSFYNRGFKPDDLVDVFEIIDKPGFYVFVPQRELPNLTNSATIYGRVTDETGKPVPQGAKIKLSPYVEPKYTDAEGFYRFDNVPVPDQTTEYTISVEKIGYHSPTPKIISVSPGNAWEVNITLKSYDLLEPFGKIINIVKDATTGMLLDGVSVRSYNTETERLSDGQLTSLAGACLLSVNTGIHDLTFFKEGYATKEIKNNVVTANDTVNVETFLEKINTNQNPAISVLTANPLTINAGATSTITCNASNPDGDLLSYFWTPLVGSISGSGSTVTWTAPSAAGTYTVTCSVSDGKGGSASKGVNIIVSVPTTNGILSVTPGDRFDSSGTQGGPFSPSNKTYTLSNTGGTSINWTASKGQSWVSLSATSGTLSPGTSTTVTVSINSNANSLAPGNYVDLVNFTNTTNGNGDTNRTVNLTVNYSTPTITVGPTSLNLGNVMIGSCSTAEFAIQHVSGTGSASGTVIASPNPPFSITAGSSFSVSDGSAANVTVRFCPSSSGTFSGTATVASSATFTGTNTVTLTGTGVTSGGDPVERVTNGSFTSGSSGWTLSGDFWAGTGSRYRTSPGCAAGGVDSTGEAKNNASGYMYQTVAIPSDATSATLSFWLNITSDETTTTTQYDKLYVEILNSSGALLSTLATYSNLDKGPYCSPSCIYNQKSFNLISYKGQAIRIKFRATTDSYSYTVFRIDDISLMADGTE